MWQQTETPSSVTPKARRMGTEWWDGGGAPSRGRARPECQGARQALPMSPQMLPTQPFPWGNTAAPPPVMWGASAHPASASSPRLSPHPTARESPAVFAKKKEKKKKEEEKKEIKNLFS